MSVVMMTIRQLPARAFAVESATPVLTSRVLAPRVQHMRPRKRESLAFHTRCSLRPETSPKLGGHCFQTQRVTQSETLRTFAGLEVFPQSERSVFSSGVAFPYMFRHAKFWFLAYCQDVYGGRAHVLLFTTCGTGFRFQGRVARRVSRYNLVLVLLSSTSTQNIPGNEAARLSTVKRLSLSDVSAINRPHPMDGSMLAIHCAADQTLTLLLRVCGPAWQASPEWHPDLTPRSTCVSTSDPGVVSLRCRAPRPILVLSLSAAGRHVRSWCCVSPLQGTTSNPGVVSLRCRAPRPILVSLSAAGHHVRSWCLSAAGRHV